MDAVPHHPLCGKEIMPVKQPPKSAEETAVEIGKIVEAMFCGSYAPLRECEINKFAEIISYLLATARKEAREAAFKDAAELCEQQESPEYELSGMASGWEDAIVHCGEILRTVALERAAATNKEK